MRKTLVIAAALAGTLVANAANAAFVISDTAAPAASTIPVTASNVFRTQLGAAGVNAFTVSASLALDAAATVNATYWGKEASYVNAFLWSGTEIFRTGGAGIDPWGANTTVVSRSASSGVLPFSFCAITTGQCLTNAQNDAQGMGAAQNIGLFVTPGGNTAWLLWDDGGGGAGGDDHDYNDMIVRLQIASASVPEPATLGLLGLGLMGAGLASRRRTK